MIKAFLGLVKYIAIIFIVTYLFTSLFMSATVEGISMQPSYHEEDVLFVGKFSQITGSGYEIGDVVIAEYDDMYIVKRVAAGPNSEVVINHDELYVDGEQYDLGELYYDNTELNLQVPDQCYYLLGDNRLHSLDSREIGCIPEEDIVGKVYFKLWNKSNLPFRNQ